MRWLLRHPYLCALVLGCAAMTSIRPLLRRDPAPPPELRAVPRFELVTTDGRAFGSDDLRGHVYVVNFFFTRCATICPALMRAMAALQERFREAGIDSIRLVSITADPVYDTPERLRVAQAAYGVDPSRWVLLSGAPAAIHSVAVNGFEVPLGDPAVIADGAFDLPHADQLMLVDAKGTLRGYYRSDADGLDEIFWRARHVLREAGGR
ncbi:MAG: SCO family protein [Candidatus Binatia bacterium]